jgi:hypothetical protein
MQQIGYSLIDSNGSELQAFGDIAGQCAGVPDMARLTNGDAVHCPALNEILSDGSKLVPRFLDDPGPSTVWFSRKEETKSYDGSNFVVTVTYGAPSTLVDAKSAALAYLADRRWQAETGGTTVNNSPVTTDAQSQAKITSAVVAAMLDANYSVQWKMPGGNFVTFNHDQIIAIGQAMRAHVQACFDREAELSAQINGASDAEALAAIDLNAGWPA